MPNQQGVLGRGLSALARSPGTNLRAEYAAPADAVQVRKRSADDVEGGGEWAGARVGGLGPAS